MTWVLRIVGGLVVLVLVAALVLPTVIKTEDLVEQAERSASGTLGREVSIGEVTGLSVLPPRITISDFEVANAEGFSAPYLVRVDEARFAVAFMPLLRGQVQIDTFVLESPSINLEEKADGSTNYEFGAAEATEPAAVTEDAVESDEAPAPADAPDVSVLSGTILITNGALSYVTPDASYNAVDTDITVRLPGEKGALAIDGAMTLEGVPFSLNVQIDEPSALAEGGTSTAKIGVQIADNSIDTNLSLTGEPVNLQGTIKGNLPDIAGLSPLLGAEGAEALAPLGAVSFNAAILGTTEQLQVTDAKITSAILQGTADFALGLTGEIPNATGSADLALVDLRPFMPEEETAGEGVPAEDEPFPEWSEEPIDLSALTMIDADFDVNASRVILPTYELTNVQAKVLIDNGLLTATLTNANAFSGTFSGTVSVNAARSTPTLGVDLIMDGIAFAEAGPALLGTDRLIGSGNMEIDIETSGASMAAWVDDLDGDVDFNLSDGTLMGIDLPQITAAGIQLVNDLKAQRAVPASLRDTAGSITNGAVGDTAQTVFNLADLNIDMTNGIADISLGQLTTDTAKVSLGGAVNLPSQGLGLSITMAGKAPGTESYEELILPIAVSGTFNDPKISVDSDPLNALLQESLKAGIADQIGIEREEGESIRDTLQNQLQDRLPGVIRRRRPPNQ